MSSPDSPPSSPQMFPYLDRAFESDPQYKFEQQQYADADKKRYRDDSDDTASNGSSTKRPRTHSSTSSVCGGSAGSDDALSISYSPDTSLDDQLPAMNANFYDFVQYSGAYVDKTEYFLKLPSEFRLVLLRPGGFGKTVFISAMHAFYDTDGAADNVFSILASNTYHAESFQQRPRHACLVLDLTSVAVGSTLASVLPAILSRMCMELCVFIDKYPEVVDCNTDDFYASTAEQFAELFTKLLSSLRERNQKIFFGVDNYDGPIRTSGAPSPIDPATYDPSLPAQLEQTLETALWEPLYRHRDVVSKLFVTGALDLSGSPSLPSLRRLELQNDPGLDLVCGFTDDEARRLWGQFVDEEPDMEQLRATCGQYRFSNKASSTLLHPQRLFMRIAADIQANLYPFPRPLALVQVAVWLDGNDNEETLQGLVDLVANGTALISRRTRPFSFAAICERDLYDSGALTRDPDGDIRIVNNEVLSMIHDAISSTIENIYHFSWAILEALPISDGFQPLLSLLSTMLRTQLGRNLAKESPLEPCINGVFELVVRNAICVFHKEFPPLVLGPPQALIVQQPPPGDDREPVHWALKTVSLRALWTASNPNAPEPPLEALAEFHRMLIKEQEASIRARFYVASDGRVLRVEDDLHAQPGVNVLVAVGAAHVLMPQAV
ncbi:hypothetical protein GGX14DRAFT_634935 [Mycena pura]|uniref:AAA-ATPase-like domain-containing protein n=1 Tax=Mycena pura TaxID=153505 RepID=A0AAD6VC87_9AGAR|nr:hypothetical protein GGX14DRAFT_634935 [Mycena pura]